MISQEKTKICSKCKQEKSVLEFRERIDVQTGREYYYSQCRECEYEYSHLNQREHNLWKNYNILPDQYKMMLKSQNGVCRICGQLETMKKNGKIQQLSVDHDHKTGKIRGLLCDSCNRALGLLKDDPKISRAMTEYLEENHG